MTIIDARTLENGVTMEPAALCIIGAGIAGISIAMQFIDTHYRIYLLESGGFDAEEATQALYAGKSTGVPYDLSASRTRHFGGSSNCWQGWCARMQPDDFEARGWIAHSGWPIGENELAPHYPKAAEMLDLSDAAFDTRTWDKDRRLQPIEGMDYGLWHTSTPTRFGEKYRQALADAANITVLLHANVTHIATSENDRNVTHINVSTMAKNHFRIRAEHYVLACGGLENARLLLHSRTHNPAGLGNRHDNVGRFFMEHPHLYQFATIVYHEGRPIGDGRSLRDNNTVLNLTLQPELRQRERLLSPCLEVFSSGTDIPPDARTIATHGAEISFMPPFTRTDHIHVRMEQSPNPESRVTLGEKKDMLGMHELSLQWRIHENDFTCLRTAMEVLARHLGLKGYGLLRINNSQFIERGVPSGIEGGNHHMGTTRMSEDPANGVVDKNCRLHGTHNLFIAGSSVFATSGWANPTFTIVALALRLADHLKGNMK